MSNNEILFSLPYFSTAMKAEIEHTNWKFSDFETATIVYNWSLPYENKFTFLKEIAARTTDDNLKIQIKQRIEIDNLLLETFKLSNPKCVFVVLYSDHSIHGIYGEFSTAMRNSEEIKDKFTVCKYQIISSRFEPLVSQTLVGIRDSDSEHQTVFEHSNQIPDKLGEMYFDENGRLTAFYVWEVDNEQTREVDNLDSERFENAFVPYPIFFDEGDRVKVPKLSISGTVYSTKQVYQQIIDEAKTNKIYDYFDTFVRIDFVDEGDHTHVSPFLMEFDD